MLDLLARFNLLLDSGDLIASIVFDPHVLLDFGLFDFNAEVYLNETTRNFLMALRLQKMLYWRARFATKH